MGRAKRWAARGCREVCQEGKGSTPVTADCVNASKAERQGSREASAPTRPEAREGPAHTGPHGPPPCLWLSVRASGKQEGSWRGASRWLCSRRGTGPQPDYFIDNLRVYVTEREQEGTSRGAAGRGMGRGRSSEPDVGAPSRDPGIVTHAEGRRSTPDFEHICERGTKMTQWQ